MLLEYGDVLDVEELWLGGLGDFRKFFNFYFKSTIAAQTVKTTINRLKKDNVEVTKEDEVEKDVNEKKEKKQKNEDDKVDKKDKKDGKKDGKKDKKTKK